jgi:hypothetical protein
MYDRQLLARLHGSRSPHGMRHGSERRLLGRLLGPATMNNARTSGSAARCRRACPPGSRPNDAAHEPEKLITDATVWLYAAQLPGLSESLQSVSTNAGALRLAPEGRASATEGPAFRRPASSLDDTPGAVSRQRDSFLVADPSAAGRPGRQGQRGGRGSRFQVDRRMDLARSQLEVKQLARMLPRGCLCGRGLAGAAARTLLRGRCCADAAARALQRGPREATSKKSNEF